MEREPSLSKQTQPRKKADRVSKKLVALSSTAVLAVYTAGYFRTQSAADKFAQEEKARESARPMAPLLEVRAQVPEAPTNSDLGLVASIAPAPPKEVADFSKPVPLPEIVAAPVSNEPPKSMATAVITPISEPAPALIPPPSSTPAPPVPTEVTNSALTAAAPAIVARSQWKDGMYIGWGSCRHGDIGVAVIIKDGRIASAQITQCLTRYDCGIIGKLPNQVVARQSPEVDYVSGATQSTNAYYYAVVEALGKARFANSLH